MKQRLRTFIVIGAIISWALVAISGLVLYFTPKGPGLGRRETFLNFTRGDVVANHPTLGLIAVVFVVLHIIIEWDIFVALLKNLIKKGQK